MKGARSAVIAVCCAVWKEPLSIFTRRGVSGDGVGHATGGHYVVTHHGKEEGLSRFVTNSGLEHPLLLTYWEPSASFVRMGG